MLKTFKTKNYKSIEKVSIELGQVNIFVGDNWSGKSNILEAIAFASAATNNKLDNESLIARGITVTEPQLMRSAFQKQVSKETIDFFLETEEGTQFKCELINDNSPYSRWINTNFAPLRKNTLGEFKIYTPSIKSLQIPEKEGQVYPIGINGDGVFNFLKLCSQKQFDEIKENMKAVGWRCEYPINCSNDRNSQGKHFEIDFSCFSCKTPSEAYLFLWFYFSLFISDTAPHFFAIEKVDASLNPKLCRKLMQDLIKLAKKYNKQVIFTASNPGVLDGLDLTDNAQRLFVVSRNQIGRTKIRRILSPKPLEQQEPVKLSEAFLRGYLGGLSKNF
jgi:AAA15 family ATPase/GTPase